MILNMGKLGRFDLLNRRWGRYENNGKETEISMLNTVLMVYCLTKKDLFSRILVLGYFFLCQVQEVMRTHNSSIYLEMHLCHSRISGI